MTETGEFILPSVIDGSITKTIVQSQEWKSMSGNSNYAYTKEMNQGSLGVSGSYGLSGLSTVDAAVSAYVGHSSATSGKSVQLNYEVKVLGGIQHIDFDNLTAATLCAALADTPRQMLEDALEKYNALNTALEPLIASDKTLLNVLGDPATYPEESRLYDEWSQAVSDFNRSYGDAIVIGVAWGGIGTVSMDIKTKSDDSSWKYGGEAEFSYAGPAASVAVSAAYDGSQSKGKADVTVICTSFASGSCVKTQTDAWFNEVDGKAFSELADVNVLDKAPDMTLAAKPPKVPAFVKPKPDSTLVSKLGEIKDLKGLKAYAQASAYDKAVAAAKKAGKEPPALSDFLKNTENPADAGGVARLAESVEGNDVNALSPDNDNDGPPPPGGSHAGRAMAVDAQPMLAPAAARAEEDDAFSDYVPLGVWVASWADLFPWLATGYLNSVTDTKQADSSIRYRVLIQDFLALSKLYYIADSCKFSFPNVSKIDFKKIADSFAGSCATLQQSGPPAIQDVLKGLSKDAMAIYKKWNENYFLRGCELGLAVLDNSGYSPKIPISQELIADGSKCAFDPETRTPYSEFANCYKLLPLILPDGTILAIGPDQSLLVDYDEDSDKFIFSHGPTGNPLGFTANAAEKTLHFDGFEDEFTLTLIRMYPVPFSAANGIEWRGQAFSTNVAADNGLRSQLSQIKDNLGELPAWSFSSEAWSPAWTGGRGYSTRGVRKRYVGLVAGLADKLG